MDENQNVPAYVGENADLAAEDAEQAREAALHAASETDQEWLIQIFHILQWLL